jgi:TonB-linked SusC/RagA family outer membrane protein
MERKSALHFFKMHNYQKIILIFLSLQLLFFSALYAQKKVVSGNVTDANGNRLAGVTVAMKDGPVLAATDSLGFYSVTSQNSKEVLVFSSVGFANKEEVVGNRSIINVSMLAASTGLDEVVVIGYGTQRKRDVTGAITSITAKSIEEKQPVSVFDALLGAAPGVRVMSNSGDPGDESSITIRGVSTLSDAGTQPLFIVDGVPVRTIGSLNPKDIQSMEILKDAASAAIYGSRSANGVIIITTKRGSEGKPEVRVDYLQSLGWLSNRVPQANRLERVMFERRTSLGLDPKADDSTSFSRNADNDYQDIMTQTAVRKQIDVGIGGGSGTLNYYNSLQYLDERGIVISSYNKRFTLRSNVEYRPSKKLSLFTRLNFSYQNKDNINEGNVIQAALRRPPSMALYLPSGEFIYFNGGQRNPIAEAYQRKDISKIYRGILYQGLDFQLLNPLTFHADVSADVAVSRSTEFASKNLSSSLQSSGSDRTDLPIRLQGNAYFSFKKRYNNIHNITGLLGTNVEKNKLEVTNIEGSYFVSEAVTTLNAAGVYDLSNLYSKGSGSALLGYYARLGYDYKGKYLLNATIRRDGSSVFGADNRWGNFPSVSLGWRFTDESFMDRLKSILTDGKLRLSWGMTGNQEIGDYDAYQQFIFGSYFYNGTSGVRTNTSLGNNLLKWESTTQTNVGLDLTFFNGRLSFVGDYYIKNTNDLLYNSPLPYEIGFPSGTRTNAGAIQNKGIELMVSGYPVRTKNLTWQTSLNWTKIKNTIRSLPTDYIDDIWSIRHGQAAGNFFGYKYLGIYQYDQSNAYTEDYSQRLIPIFQKDQQGNVIIEKNMQPVLLGYTYQNGTPYTGIVKQMTTNEVISKGGDVIWQNLPDSKGVFDGNIGSEDRQYLGNGQPTWSLGFSNSINYKHYSLSFNLYGNFGNKIYNEFARSNATFSSSNSTPFANFIEDMWKYPGQITNTYRGGDKTADNMRRGGSQFLEDGSFVRLQSVRIGYVLPERLTRIAAVKSFQAYIYGTNLLTWTSYTGFDPEVGQASVLKPGNDPGRFPRRREIGAGVNITF